MKKQGKQGLEELMRQMAIELQFDYYDVRQVDNTYRLEFGYDLDGEMYGLEVQARVLGPKMFQWAVQRVISYMVEDMARR